MRGNLLERITDKGQIMKSASAKTSFITKATRLAVFALLFTLVLGVTLSAILYTDVINESGSQTADATAGKYYSIDSSNKIIISASAIDGTTFSLDETWDNTDDSTKEAAIGYWTYVCTDQSSPTIKYTTILDGDGAGIEANSADKAEYSYSGYSYLTLVPEEGLTITKINVSTGYIYAKTAGSNSSNNKTHTSTATLSVIAGSSSVNVASVKASEYGNRDKKETSSGSNSLTATVDSSGSIQIRLTGSFTRKSGSYQNKVRHLAQVRDISISIEGTYSLPGSGTEADPYKLRNRSDFDLFSDKVNRGDSDFVSAYYIVEPNSANGQTAYSAGGRTIDMLSDDSDRIYSMKEAEVLSVATEGNSGEEIAKLFDGDISTKYCQSTNGKLDVKIDYGYAISVRKYRLYNGADTESKYNDRRFKSITIKGSNDNINWVTLTTSLPDEYDKSSSQYFTGTLSNLGCYRYFNITAECNSGSTIQMAELDFIGPSFTPIGTELSQFKGSINGNGCTISGLVIPDQKYSGLFGNLGSGANIYDLTVNGTCSGTSTNSHAVLAGHVSGTVTITNCTTKGSVTAGIQVGGLVGFADGATLTISGCRNEATVTGTSITTDSSGNTRSCVGGLVGYANATSTVTINGSSNSGAITGQRGIGGLVGFSYSTLTIGNTSACENSGTINGGINVGGIVGYMAKGSVINARNTGSVIGSATYGGDKDYSIVQYDAYGYSDQTIDKINDGSTGTKYYSEEKGSMSFVMQVASGTLISGFSITNANDTASQTNRMPKRIYIWGAYTNNFKTTYPTGGGNYEYPDKEDYNTDGYKWTKIYSSEDIGLGSTNYYRKNYNLDKTYDYIYYYVYIDNGTHGSGKLQFSEFDFLYSENVGGVVGNWTLDADTTAGTLEHYGTVAGVSYVGGIVGNLNTNGKNLTGTFKVGTTYGGTNYTALDSSGNNSQEIVAHTGSFAGGIFGYTTGGAKITFENGTIVTGQIDACESIGKDTGNFVGGAVGANIGVTLDFSNCSTTPLNISIISRISRTQTIGDTTFSNVAMLGGVVGYNAGTITGKSGVDLVTIYDVKPEFFSVILKFKGTRGDYVGGIVGYNASAGTIKNCETSIQVGTSNYWENYTGGIAGYNVGTVTGAYVHSAVYGVSYVGGYFGYTTKSFSTSNNHSAAVKATGDYAGGYVGYFKSATADDTLSFSNCTNSGSVEGVNYVGGFVGYATGYSDDTNSSWATTISFNTVTNKGTISATGHSVGGVAGYLCFANFTGTVENQSAVTGSYQVGGIIGYSAVYKYTTTVDGKTTTTIKGQVIFDTSTTSVKNTGKITANGSGNYAGGIFGFSQDTKINGGTVSNEGEISAENVSYVGGIAGFLYGSTLPSTTSNTGAVTGYNYTGGIAGRIEYGTINGNNSGRIIGHDYVGGIVGEISNVQNAIASGANLRNTAIVSGNDYIGGIVGKWTLNADTTNVTLEHYGTVAGSSYVGGIAGQLDTNGKNLTGIFKVGYMYDDTYYTQDYQDDKEVWHYDNKEVVSHIGAFGGGIFGYTTGGATITFSDGTLVAGELDANEGNIAGSTRDTGVVLGGAVGANIDVTLDFSNCSTTPITSNIIGRTAQDVTINGTEYKSIGMLGGVVGYNSGTLIGKADINIISTGSIFNVVNGGYVGGVVGYNTGTIKNCRSGVTTIGGNLYRANYTGGVIGYNSSADVSGIYADSNIYGYSQIGGYIGHSAVEFTFSGLTYTKSISAWGSYVGGFVGYATQKTTFNNCTNSGTIVGTGNRVGGFIGEGTEVVFTGSNVNTGVITGGSYNTNTGERSNGDYTGGFVGNATTRGTFAHLVNTGKVTAYGNYTGGIIGSANNVAFTYCYNKSVISGYQYVGGIVGGGSGNTITNCYVEIDSSSKIEATSGSNVGGIVGTTAGTTTDSWAFYYGSVYTDHNTGTTASTGKYVLIYSNISQKVYPCTVSGSTFTDCSSWDNIKTKDINGFYIASGVKTENGNYLSLRKASNVISGTLSLGAYATPNSLENTTANSDGSVTFGKIKYKSDFAGNIDVRFAAIENITYNNGTDNVNLIYEHESKIKYYNWNGNITGYSAVFTTTSGDDVNVSTGGFKYKVEIKASSQIFGQKLNNQGVTIQPYDISSSDAVYGYSGSAYGMSKYSFLYNITSFKDNTEIGVIEYDSNTWSGYKTKFYIVSDRKARDANGYLTNVSNAYMYGSGYTYATITVTHSTPATSDGVLVDRLQKKQWTKFEGSGNFTGEVTLYYTLIDSDFGVLDGKTRDKTWGSESNPFVISNWIYLQRLSDIVNGTMQPIDSVKNYSKLTSADTNAKTIFYDGCYFVVTADIAIPDGIIFNPIGGYAIGSATSYNQGVTSATSPKSTSVSYFGGNIESDISTTTRSITIGDHLNYADGTNRHFLGLFGYVYGNSSKAGVKNIAVLGNVNSGGGDYVGGVVGYANNAVIDSCYVNASGTTAYTVGGNDYVGSIVGYLGKGSELYGNISSSSYLTVAGANYVGGFIGAIEQGAGYDAGGSTYVVGNNGDKVLKLVNYATISTNTDSEYVGGIVGAIGKDTDTSSTNITKFAPEIARNLSNISGQNYIGGIVGAVWGSNVIALENAENSDADTWSYNGTYSGDDVYTVAGTDNIGGIAGYLGAGNNLFTRVFSTATVSGGSFVGGLVGQVKGGSFVSCFVSEPGTKTVEAGTDKVNANTQYAGGLAGSADGANVSFTDCYVQGFNWSRVSASSGGVAGYASSTVKFENSWALYLADGADYTTVSPNANGKYIIADSNFATSTANIYEMAIFAGLLTSTAQYSAGKTNTSYLGKGIIPLGVTLPTPGTLSDATTKAQIVFYDASGTETATDNKFDAENDSASASMIYIYLGVDAESMSVCARQVVFNNVSDYTSETAWENAYLSLTKPIQNREKQYTADVTLTNTAGPYAGTFKISFIANYTVSGSTVTGTAVFVSRNVSFSYKNNTEVAPLIINDMDDWTSFANAVRGTDGTYTGYVKLTANIGTTSNPVTLPAGYNSTSDVNKFRFGGTFDGNGYTITVRLWASALGSNNEIGLFPQAAGATFKNLTIAGSVGVVKLDENNNPTADASASGNDIGAFVGIARGDLTFLNCKNQAYVSGGLGHNTGGLVGTAHDDNDDDGTAGPLTYNVTFVDCVNEGTVISAGNYGSKGEVSFGVGGIMGTTGSDIGSEVTFESCRNAAAVASDANVGGILGVSANECIIRNCGNTGNIIGTDDTDDTCVGGIAGIGTEAGSLNIYASYNSGQVVAQGNKAGGILGGDSEYTSASGTTCIYYCYNTGSVYTGGLTARTKGGVGVQAGGIIGTMTDVDIQYCYNVGTITANGIVYLGANTQPEARVGGIAGYSSSGAKIKMDYCYNVGLIVIGANLDTTWFNEEKNEADYGAGIIGLITGNFYNSNVTIGDHNFSLKWQVYRPNKSSGTGNKPDGGKSGTNYKNYKWQTYCEYETNYSYSGTILPSIADLTAAYFSGSSERIVPLTANRNYNSCTANDESNSTVTFGATGSAAVMNTKGTKTYGGATTVTATGVNTGIENGSLGGYIYVYGCLPQLACFALDTKNGLAMTSMGYGYDEVNEQYVLQPAGGEHNPYIIKDGIDLMSLTAITQPNPSHYDFDGEYIEFADSTNNLAGDICTYINLPTDENGLANAYKFANNGGTLTEGKSYHIYKYGAVIQRKKNYYETGTNSYTQWKNRNTYYDESSSAFTASTATAPISAVNYYPVGMFGNSADRTFKGTINGSLKTINANNIHQTDWDGTSKAEVRGLKLDRTIGHSADIYAGLFAFIEDATVANIKVSGTITGRAISSGKNVHAGLVGYAMGESVLDGLETASLTIQAINKTGNTRTNAVGGILGVAEPAKEETITIKNCIVGSANVVGDTKIIGFGPNIGGIIGVSSSRTKDEVAADASAQVIVENCNVRSAEVNSDKAVGTLVGGIVGKCDDVGSLTVTGSSVGSIGTTTTSTDNQKVKIYGSYSIGGIAGNAVANANSNMAFIDCTVYGDVLIQRIGTTNDGTFGTAIGGIVGYISNDATAFSLFRGTLGFHGTIDATLASTEKVYNIGGAVGYMGTSAVFDSIDVHIYGKINTPTSGTVENVGGFAGYGAGGTLDGTFFVAPTLSCANANYVGGFIGLNGGNTAITRTSEIYTAKEDGTSGKASTKGGAITGKYYVGGFIGGNTASGDNGLYIGAKEFLGASYGSDGDFAIIELYSSVDGKAYIGGFLGRNEGNLYGEYCQVNNYGQVGASSTGTSSNYVEIIGGIVGSNGGSAKISFGTDATFQNDGQVGNSTYKTAYQKFVGGILGANAGAFANSGTLVNTGSVYGYEYVGGAIGLLISGNISGKLANGVKADGTAFAMDSDALACTDSTTGNASVTAVSNVGGVIGAMLGGASITATTATTELYNYGKVTATADISNAGGIIGLMYGKIEGTSANKVTFANYGEVNANSFAGGIIGVVDGLVNYASFTNYSASMTFGGNTAMGGAIGLITTGYGNDYYPTTTLGESVSSTVPKYADNNQSTHITDSYFAYEPATEGNTVSVTATGTTPDTPYTINNKNYAGGLGGVIGVIDASDIDDKADWSGNSYYVNGSVYGTGVDGVGGFVGAINGAKVIIDNMLVYLSTVSGRYNVGGIVGYNGSSVTDEASIVNCFNVKGEVIGSLKNGKSTYGGIVGYAATYADDSYTYTDGSYWIKESDNNTLNKVDPDNISGTLDAAFNVAGEEDKSGYGTYLDAETTFETVTNTDTEIKTISTTKYGQLYSDDNGTAINANNKAGMSTTLYYKTTTVTTTSTYDSNESEWTTTSSTSYKYTAIIGTPANTLNFSLAYMSAHPDEPSALGYTSWAELATTYNSELVYNSALGYGSYGAAGNIVYTTGDIQHGFFYVYATDVGSIKVDIQGSELAQWNIIANTPVKGEINDSQMTYNSGAIETGHIYTTATVPDGTGYYVYFYGTTPNPGDSDAESDYSALSVHGKTSSGATGTIYFDWDTTQYEKDANGNNTKYGAVGNVLIYYKKTTMESGLVYNGQQRYAPITGMTYNTTSETVDSSAKMNQSYYYFDGTADGSVNTATDAGTYDVKANIWFVDSAGNKITIGSVDSTKNNEYKWTINKRDLVLTDNTNTTVGTYDGTYKHYVEFIVENSVYECINNDDLKNILGLTAENVTVTAVEKSSSMPTVGTNSTTAYYSYKDGESSKDVNDCGYTVLSDGAYGKAESVQTYTYTVRVYFCGAGSHSVGVTTNDSNIGKNYSLAETTLTVQVNRRKLTVTATWSEKNNDGEYEFNGGASYQGVTKITIGGNGTNEGFVGNDAQSVTFTITATAKVGSSTNDKLITVGEMTSQGTSSVYYDIQATDAATYTVTVEAPSSATGAAKNYVVSGAGTFTWTIDKYIISKSGVTLKTTTVTYDGKAHYIDTSAGEGTSSTNTEDVGKETVTFRVNVTYSGDGVSNNVAVNAGNYTATLATDGGGSGTGTVDRLTDCLSKAENRLDNYDIVFTGLTSGTATLTIEPAKINLTSWDVGSYVYLNKEQGPSVTGATVGGETISSGNISYSNGVLTISNIFDNNETVELTATNFRKKDAGDYTAKVTVISSVSGTNATGSDTVVGNYELGTGLTQAYSIAKSKIEFTYTGTVGDKVYDGTSTYSNFGTTSYRVSTTNEGDTSKSAISLSSAVYMNGSTAVSDTNAKTGVNAYTVRFTASLKDTKNYEWASGNTYTTSATAHITPKGLTVTLNDSNGRAYKSFDNNYEYASVESSGATSAKSKSQRTGKGITVSGFVANQASITVTVNFREEDRTNRAGFDEYVNGIFKDGETYKSGGAYNKMLEVALSSSDNSSYLNYYIAYVNRKSGSANVTIGDTYKNTQIYVLCNGSEVTNGSTINSVRAYTSNLTIEITKYTAKANYSNTSQSYANADNTYNTDWVEVSGTLRVPSSWNLDVEVKVANGWMKNSDGTAKEYTKYTRIVGSTTKSDLGATLSSATGKDLCITLRNQPTLIIGYFVVKDGSYQVGSAAGLLIATEYYKGNFKNETDETSGDDEKAYNFVVVPMAVPTDVELDVTTYPTTWEDFLEAYYTKYNESYDITKHSAYPTYQSIAEQYKKDTGLDLEEPAYGDYFIEDEKGNVIEKHGYYYWQPIEVEVPTYTDFVQVNDFDMIVTDLDAQIIKEAFGENWESSGYLTNVILFKVGSVVILSDSVFTGDFNGSYDGAGYTINHLTILATVTSGDTANIGMFAHLGTSDGVENVSTVKSVNLRNANIQVYDTRTSGTLNVGGIVGYNQSVNVLSDCTFHGTITVTSGATVNAGGLVGKDEASVADFTIGETTVSNTPVYGGTVIATITVIASTANVGGIVGLAYTGNTYSGVVSVSEIYVTASTANAGGILGAVNTGSATVTDGYYLQKAIYGVNNGTYVSKSNAYGTAKSYDELYNGSNTNYNNGVMGETANQNGTYDFVSDVQPQASASETADVAPRESMRLADIIDTHVLGYKLSTTNITVDTNKTATAYQKATVSELVGNANGTTDSRIGIAHQQHLSLIYAFNYMNFELKKHIVMYTGYELKSSPEAFIGSMTSNGYFVNVRTATASETTPTPFKYSDESINWITTLDSVTQG